MVSITHAKTAWKAWMACESAGDEPKDVAECRGVPVRESGDVDRRAGRGGRSCRSARGLSGPGPRPLLHAVRAENGSGVQGQPNLPMHVPGGSDRGHVRFEESRGVPVKESGGWKWGGVNGPGGRQPSSGPVEVSGSVNSSSGGEGRGGVVAWRSSPGRRR